MAQETGKLLRWIKSEGDAVTKGEPLMEIETDKVTVEIEAPANGTLAGYQRRRRRGCSCWASGRIRTGRRRRPSPTGTIPADPADEPVGLPGRVPTERFFDGRSRTRRGGCSRRRRRDVSPASTGVRIEDLRGTGPHGAIQAGDVVAAGCSARQRPAGRVLEQPTSSNAWKTMAERMQQAWREVPHFYLDRDLDATRLNSWRDTIRRRPGYETGHAHRSPDRESALQRSRSTRA